MSLWQEIDSREEWNNFVAKHPSGSFLQSFEFSNFHQSLGKKIWRLGLRQEALEGVCLLIKQNTKLGSFLYSPGGPVLSSNQAFDSLIKLITQIGKDEKVSFARLDPRTINDNLASETAFQSLKKINNFTQPQCTQILDLTKSMEEIRSGFSESTKYNIRAVERKGVKIIVSERLEDVQTFEKLLAETAKRHRFQLHAEVDYYKKQFEVFTQAKQAKLYLAQEPPEDGVEILAAAIVVNFGDTVTYLHAASSGKNPKLRAPYLMQWRIIEDAKNSGASKYDFWGVSPSDSSSDPWAGVTGFKKGFGGEKVCYSAPYDLVFGSKYYLDSILEKFRLIIRKWH